MRVCININVRYCACNIALLSNSSNQYLNEKSNQAEEVEVSNLLRMMADVIILYYILF